MALVWVNRSSASGPCPSCLALDGHREGDGWSRDPGEGQVGPPPLHHGCVCEVVEDDVLEHAAWLRDVRGF